MLCNRFVFIGVPERINSLKLISLCSRVFSFLPQELAPRLLTVLLVLSCLGVKAQNNFLSVSIEFPSSNLKATEALSFIEANSDVKFSYNAELLSSAKIFHFSGTISVLDVCKELTENSSVRFAQIGDQIVFYVPVSRQSASEETDIDIPKIPTPKPYKKQEKRDRLIIIHDTIVKSDTIVLTDTVVETVIDTVYTAKNRLSNTVGNNYYFGLEFGFTSKQTYGSNEDLSFVHSIHSIPTGTLLVGLQQGVISIETGIQFSNVNKTISAEYYTYEFDTLKEYSYTGGTNLIAQYYRTFENEEGQLDSTLVEVYQKAPIETVTETIQKDSILQQYSKSLRYHQFTIPITVGYTKEITSKLSVKASVGGSVSFASASETIVIERTDYTTSFISSSYAGFSHASFFGKFSSAYFIAENQQCFVGYAFARNFSHSLTNGNALKFSDKPHYFSLGWKYFFK